jgi:energy-coupling factor transporter ATP-binding protein EcfA2
MLTELRLENFRGFENHRISFRPTTILVGCNNAGKSTVAEALHLLSVVVTRYGALVFSEVPDWLEIPRRHRGVIPSLRGLEINFDTMFYHYGSPPAIITATFVSGATVTIYLGSQNRIFAVIMDSSGQPVTTKRQAVRVQLPKVSALPQVAPLALEEKVLSPETVRRAMLSPLASSHFRNQLNLFYGYFETFKRVSEETWPGFTIKEFLRGDKLPGTKLALMVRDRDFVAEVAWMGHGLQMWLQTMWFLTRSSGSTTLILDEPDVYMHADLQRRLIRFLRRRQQQVIITTHSIEIMAEVDPEHVSVVDRKKRESTFTTSISAVQRIVNQIGGVHNLHLARLWTSQRCLLVEGKDLQLLKHFQNTLFPSSLTPIDIIPNMSIGGWGGWNHAVGSSMILKNAVGENIVTYCIFDSDYHAEDEILERYQEAGKRGVQLHVWRSKEIENYLLVPSAVYRVVLSNIARRTEPPSPEEISRQIDQIADDLRDPIFDAIAHEHLARDRRGGLPVANRNARARVNEAWKTADGRLSIVPGKEVISRLSEWCQQEFGVSLSPALIARELRRDEISPEVVSILTAIENGEALPIAEPGTS